MERREFVGTSIAALCTAAGAAVEAAPKAEPSDLYELQCYTLKTAKLPLLNEYLGQAFIPALKRLGIGPVGVFTELSAPGAAEGVERVHVLIVHKSADEIPALAGKLNADATYLKAAAPYLAAKAADPVYTRIESSLLHAIAGMPKIDKPDPTKPRLLNLRIYESHNERAAAKKIEMFEKGELEIFRRVGLKPVFFASSVVGAAMPNLTYMLVFPNEDGRKAAWDRFRADDAWLKLKAIPEYADKEIISKITNRILEPASYSEI